MHLLTTKCVEHLFPTENTYETNLQIDRDSHNVHIYVHAAHKPLHNFTDLRFRITDSGLTESPDGKPVSDRCHLEVKITVFPVLSRNDPSAEFKGSCH